MGARVPALSPNDHPNPSLTQQKVFLKKVYFGKFFSHAKLKTAKSSLARTHRGADWEYLALDRRPPRLATYRPNYRWGSLRGAGVGKSEIAPGTLVVA